MHRAVSSKRALRVLSSALKDKSATQSASRSICLPCQEHRPAPRAVCAQKRPSILSLTDPTARLASTLPGTTGLPESGNSPHLPDLSSHYTIFPNTLPRGPPPAGPFNIDLASLRREFLQLQGRFHPDKFPPEQKAKAESLSARINEAYKALGDPLVRAQYLLSHIYGIDVTSEDNNAHPTEAGILMEVMDAQESIEEAETEEQIEALKKQNQERIEQTLEALDEAFSGGDAELARKECVRLRYWASIGEGLTAWNGKGSEVRLVH